VEGRLATLKVMCARSMHGAVGALGGAFARSAGHEIDFDFGTVGALQAKLDAGETADVLILSRSMIDKLEAGGALLAGSRADVARTFIAVCIRAGAAAPDIGTPESFKRALESARAVAMSDPAVGGSAAVYVPVVFERLGIAELMRPKSLLQKNGVEVARPRADPVRRSRFRRRSGHRRAAAAALRPGDDLRSGCRCEQQCAGSRAGLRRRPDRLKRPRHLAAGRVRSAAGLIRATLLR
jgi:hypothetical protein